MYNVCIFLLFCRCVLSFIAALMLFGTLYDVHLSWSRKSSSEKYRSPEKANETSHEYGKSNGAHIENGISNGTNNGISNGITEEKSQMKKETKSPNDYHVKLNGTTVQNKHTRKITEIEHGLLLILSFYYQENIIYPSSLFILSRKRLYLNFRRLLWLYWFPLLYFF